MEEFDHCLIPSTETQILSRRSFSFSDLMGLDAPRGDELHIRKRNAWEIDPSEIKLGRRIAVGGFAEVFVGEYQVRHSGQSAIQFLL